MLKRRKASERDFTVIDVGASANAWTQEVLDATFDLSPIGILDGDGRARCLHFCGNINEVEAWGQVLEHVRAHGKFSFSVCSHTLEDVTYPVVALRMLPLISEAGFVSMPSCHRELTRGIEGPWRGYIHHRWVFRVVGGVLTLIPKVPFLEHSSIAVEACPDELSELQVFWDRELPYAVMNNDYLGPNVAYVVSMYEDLLKGRMSDCNEC